MSKKLLVTGATGFVGSHVCYQAMQLGYHVFAIKRASSKLSGFEAIGAFYENRKNESIEFLQKLKQQLTSYSDHGTTYSPAQPKSKITGSIQWIEADISNNIEVSTLFETHTFDLVFHAAAAVTFDAGAKDQIITDNVLLTKNIVNACLKFPQTPLLHVSSIAALGRPSNDKEINIDLMWTDSPFNTSYALSKYLSEMEVWRGAHEGLRVLVVNPGVILGYSQGNSSSNQVIQAATGKLPLVPAGSNGFIFVEDLVSRCFDLINDTENWQRRHLMVTHNLPFKDLILSINSLKGKKKSVIILKGTLWHIAYRAVKIIEFFKVPISISSELLKSTRKRSVYDNRIGFTRSRKLA